MKLFIDKFSNLIKGTILGFDRIVFKDLVLPLMSTRQVMTFCRSKGVLNKDYRKWIMKQTKIIIDNADQYARVNCGHPIIHIPTWRIRKEKLAHEQQQKEPILSGLIGVWSYHERGSSYRAVYCAEVGFPVTLCLRLMNDLSFLKEETPLCNIMDGLIKGFIKDGRKFRGLDPVGKDRELILLLSDPAFMISGFTNKMLRNHLSSVSFGLGRTDKQLSVKVSRHLKLLRVHGIIRKRPKQNKYQVTIKGMQLAKTLKALLAASTENLLKMAA